MLDALKFIQGAVKTNKLAPELEHYQITDGQIIGFNGFMALASPIDLDFNAKPKADLFNKAIQACNDDDDNMSLSLDGGSIRISSGSFNAKIRCIEDPIFDQAPTGTMYDAPPGLTAAFARLLPFISQDASRPWAMGLDVHAGCYAATNNIIIQQIWDGHQLPSFNCPRFVVMELVRIKTNPTHVQVDNGTVTFHWKDTGRWLRTLLLSDQWPHTIIDTILADPGSPIPVPEGFFEAVHTLMPFVPELTNTIRCEDGQLATGAGDTWASVAVPGLVAGPMFSSFILAQLDGTITAIDFSAYPKPCPFVGEFSRGVILGQRP